MRQVLAAITSPERAVAFDRLPREEAVRKHPELANAFIAVDRARARAAMVDPQRADEVALRFRATVSTALHVGAVIGAGVPGVAQRDAEPPRDPDR